MKADSLRTAASAIGGLTDPEVRQLAEYWAAGIPADHWIRTRGGLFLVSTIRDQLRSASREVSSPLTSAVLQRMVRLMNFLAANLD
jgi:hypothetical protein